MADSEKKKLIDLRVVDLKTELEKRSLEISGVKTILIERLEKALINEGHDPNEYLFDINKGKGLKQSNASKIVKESEPEQPKIEEIDADNKISLDTKEPEDNKESTDSTNAADDVSSPDLTEEISKDIEKKDNSVTQEVNEQMDSQKAVIEEESKDIDGETSNIDNEDSINLTIGEEEEQMLRDEEDVKIKDTELTENPIVDADEKIEHTKMEEIKVKDEQKSESEEKSKDSSSVKSGKDEVSSTTAVSSGAEKKKITAPSATTPNNNTNNQPSRNLWVSGLSALTRATDLKLIFGKYGKVVGAKIVTNTRSANQRCFGYVTMANPKDATECIENLHRTELHGRMISVERAKNDLAGASKPVVATKSTEGNKPSNGAAVIEKRKDIDVKKPDSVTSKDSKESDRKEKSIESKPKEVSIKDGDESATTNKTVRKRISPPRSSKEKSKERHRNTRIQKSREPIRRSRSREILSLNRLREERDRRRREHEREMREKELREEERRRREIRRRQYEEEQRLAREREKLELEKIKIAKEKAELLKIQRERQKLEMEKIEFERLELKRQQRKIEEEKRAIKRPLSNDRYDDDRDRDRKRPTGDRRGFEAPPPPRFDLNRSSQYERDRTTDIKKRLDDYPKRDDTYSSKSSRDDYKRDSYKSGSSRDDYKRDIEVPSRSYNSSSSRLDTASSSLTATNKDRYSDRTVSTDYRSSGSRVEDSRNTTKSRYYDSQPDTRYDRSQVVPSTTTWNASTQQFGGMATGDLWGAKQSQPENGASWSRNNIDDYRFATNDRKTSQHYQIDPTMRAAPYVNNGNSTIAPAASTRFTNNQRW